MGEETRKKIEVKCSYCQKTALVEDDGKDGSFYMSGMPSHEKAPGIFCQGSGCIAYKTEAQTRKKISFQCGRCGQEITREYEYTAPECFTDGTYICDGCDQERTTEIEEAKKFLQDSQDEEVKRLSYVHEPDFENCDDCLLEFVRCLRADDPEETDWHMFNLTMGEFHCHRNPDFCPFLDYLEEKAMDKCSHPENDTNNFCWRRHLAF